MSVVRPLEFLDAVAGYTRQESRSSADRTIRLAKIDSTYNAYAAYPGPIPAARVTFEGETTLSGKYYAVASGYVPAPNDRCYMVPIGTTYLIAGRASQGTPQGFWQDSDLDAGVEFGGGSYFDTTEGLHLETDATIEGDLVVNGVGAYLACVQGGNGPSVANSTTPLQTAGTLLLPLTVGTWELHCYGAYTSVGGDIKVAWQFTGAWSGTRHSYGVSPFSINTNTPFATPSRDAAAARASAHGLSTEVPYGANDSTNQAAFHEHGNAVVTTAGTWRIGYAQYISDAAQAMMRGSTMITARRIA